MKKSLLIIAFSSLSFCALFAQGNEFIFNWQIAVPGQGLEDLLQKTSFQGWNIEYRRALTNTITVGGSLGFNVFHEEIEESTWHFDNTAVTSQNQRYAHTVPITVTAHFNPLRNEGSPVQIFMGGGLGTAYVNQEVWAGSYTFQKDSWNFIVYPEVGLRYVMSDETALYFSTQYMYVPSGNFDNGDLTYWNFKLGFSFGTHRW
jgi:hypothetical protein